MNLWYAVCLGITLGNLILYYQTQDPAPVMTLLVGLNIGLAGAVAFHVAIEYVRQSGKQTKTNQ